MKGDKFKFLGFLWGNAEKKSDELIAKSNQLIDSKNPSGPSPQGQRIFLVIFLVVFLLVILIYAFPEWALSILEGLRK